MTQVIDNRRYDIDWLRTLAFGLLILYHVGMYYVFEWGWHIKSVQQSVWLQDMMILINPWRMSLLFFVSGMALALFLRKGQQQTSAWQVFAMRSKRLLVPLIFSMYVIVPPQLFYELQQQHGLSLGYWSFLQEYWNIDTSLAPFKHSSIGLLTWNHLWFLPYLWCYSLLLLLLKPVLEWVFQTKHCQKVSIGWAVTVIGLTTFIMWFLLRESYPTSHDLLNDWYSHAKYFWVLVCGFCLARMPQLWQKIVEQRRWFLCIALLCYGFIILDRHAELMFIAQYYQSSIWVKSFYGTIFISNHWAWILAVVGYAGHYLNFSNRFIVYANQAILPWYIFHQTLIVVIAMKLLPLHLPAFVEAPLLILLTSLGCLVGYELVRRTSLSRWLFGLKVTVAKKHSIAHANQDKVVS
jgi:glucan biosynthesis protein C